MQYKNAPSDISMAKLIKILLNQTIEALKSPTLKMLYSLKRKKQETSAELIIKAIKTMIKLFVKLFLLMHIYVK